MSAVTNPVAVGACPASDLNMLRRFLCIGTEGGTYHSNGTKPFTKEDVPCLLQLVEAGNGQEVINEIISFSTPGRSARPEAITFALAVCARLVTDLKIKQAAYKALSSVCSDPAQLFYFVDYAQKLSGATTGWGRAQRTAINEWYNSREPKDLALAVTQYVSRNGWSHTDLLRLAHVKPKEESTSLVLKFIMKGLDAAKKAGEGDEHAELLSYLEAVHTVKHSHDDHQVARLVEEHALVREHVPTALHNSSEVWGALIRQVPLEVLIRSLARLTALGLLEPLAASSHAPAVTERLKDKKQVTDSKIHPFTILVTLKMYEQGKGHKTKTKWVPNGAVVDALNDAFNMSFKNVQPTMKRLLLAVDVSTSMTYGEVNGSPAIKPLVAAAAMAMLVARTEQNYQLIAYGAHVCSVPLNATMCLTEVCNALTEVNNTNKTTTPGPGSKTDVAAPITWAQSSDKTVDAFVVFTDSETWADTVHPADALRAYRQHTGIKDAKLVVVALTSSGFTLADHSDSGMLDIVGFNPMVPNIISLFVRGEL